MILTQFDQRHHEDMYEEDDAVVCSKVQSQLKLLGEDHKKVMIKMNHISLTMRRILLQDPRGQDKRELPILEMNGHREQHRDEHLHSVR